MEKPDVLFVKKVKASAVTKTLVFNVKVIGMKTAKTRLSIAGFVIKIATWIAGSRSKIEIEWCEYRWLGKELASLSVFSGRPVRELRRLILERHKSTDLTIYGAFDKIKTGLLVEGPSFFEEKQS